MNRKRNQPANHKPNPSPTKLYTVKEPAELLSFLITTLSNQGRNSIKSILSRGQVSVNNQVVTVYNYPLQPGQTVSIRKDRASEAPPMVGLKILHEDEDIIVVQKDAGLLSVASDQAHENELTAYKQLTAHVRIGNPKNRIFIVHRLDRDTSGVMLFAKSERVQQTLQNAWQDTVKERTYVALVEGMVKKQEGTISSWLKESATLKMYSSSYPNDGQHAVTHYKVIQSNRNFSLLEVHLETGRKNQIRVHMQDMGHPIAGDKKYGSTTKPINRLGLHARVLSFIHPRSGELLRFETEIPKSFINQSRITPPQ
ncbi:RluA family pseudouridine synthase [Paenibacillus radicis (ex Xue et al. 2023)]|uniref:Pseudouridine synthase n=1 Tax=Paenibacillus radicis (ex Xue et al. 2023) TaxID=2972489 RepID=A0ABT1YJG0_9BACL|nr:RluA family pseudouridine synthase [Paenibacillus radicis (ex Xue et al. 2023)]MCR8632549.1 RluA family pseudouridine synthase [Paenibacillus radicis (ex Xue et al. 2023)]